MPRSPWARVEGNAPAGSFGDAAALSFNGNKIMTTSGGGALLTDDPTSPVGRATSPLKPGNL